MREYIGAKPAKHFVRVCAIEMHMDISQGNFGGRNDSKMGGDQMVRPYLTQGFSSCTVTPIVDKLFWEERFEVSSIQVFHGFPLIQILGS